MQRILNSLFAAFLLLAAIRLDVHADGLPPSQAAETIRSSLFAAQMNPQSADEELARAENAYGGSFQSALTAASPESDAAIQAGFETLRAAESAPQAAAARAKIWTAILETKKEQSWV